LTHATSSTSSTAPLKASAAIAAADHLFLEQHIRWRCLRRFLELAASDRMSLAAS
jgi:hypothetical protein